MSNFHFPVCPPRRRLKSRRARGLPRERWISPRNWNHVPRMKGLRRVTERRRASRTLEGVAFILRLGIWACAKAERHKSEGDGTAAK